MQAPQEMKIKDSQIYIEVFKNWIPHINGQSTIQLKTIILENIY